MFLNVFTQVAVLLILIILGVLLTRFKMLNENTVKQLTDIVLTFVTPCVIIKSFMREFDSSLIGNLVISFLASVTVHIIYIILSLLLIHHKDKSKEKVLRFAAVFSNCGFMSIPLLETILGNTGVFYGTAYLAIFNVLVWSYGIFLMSGNRNELSIKKILINPGVIGICISLIIFFFNIPLYKSDIITQPINFIANLNTPLPMIIIGYHLANSNIFESLKNPAAIFSIIMKLAVFPLLTLFGMYLCGIHDEILVAITISASAPAAAITTMFSSKFNGDISLSVSTVSLSTIISIFTMPFIITLAQYLA